MKGPPLGPGGKDIPWPDQVAPQDQKAPSTRSLKPQTAKLFHRGHPLWFLKTRFPEDYKSPVWGLAGTQAGPGQDSQSYPETRS